MIKIFAGGKIRHSLYETAWETYRQRIHLWPLTVLELSEKMWIDRKPGPREYWVLLDEKGKAFSSAQFAQFLVGLFNENHVPVFGVGPSHGLPPEVKERARAFLSLGPLTLPHLLARLILLEQIYRAQSYCLNHPYHSV